MVKKDLPEAFTKRLEFSGLTEEEKHEIRERALEQVAAEKRARVEESYMQQALDEARSADDPELRMEDVFIDLPGHAVRLLIDGVEYLHGFVYTVNELQAQSMRDMIQHAWNHEDEVGGANRQFYNKPRNTRLNRRTGNLTTRQILGA